jgi:1-acyl-sn-glycerol-3-phosphate acyltransferase
MQDIVERPVQLRGSSVARVLLRLAGWRLRFDGLPGNQGVLIVYPHTSNWDFPLGLLVKWAVGIQLTFWGKDSLFRVPLFGAWLRWLGGVPVDRHSNHGIVGQMARELAQARLQNRFLWLALAPEGTRQHASGWRSGFYHVALQAQVPVGLVFLDYGRREAGVQRFIKLGGNMRADLKRIAEELGHRIGKRPALAAPIRFDDMGSET